MHTLFRSLASVTCFSRFSSVTVTEGARIFSYQEEVEKSSNTEEQFDMA